MKYLETLSQEFDNGAVISAGFVEGHEHDSIYLDFQRPGEEGFTILLKPVEAAIIAWLMGGTLYSLHTSIEVRDGKPLRYDAELGKWASGEWIPVEES